MSLRSIASLAIALLLGLIAVVIVRNYLITKNGTGPSAASASLTPIVVAALPIERGAELKPPMLKVVGYPAGAVPAGAFKTVAEVAAANGATPRLALRAIAVNEPLMADKVSGSGGKANLSVTLTPGMRAVSIRSDDVSGVAGFVLPGDRVDILLTRAIGSGPTGTSITQLLAENALVVGVDQFSDTTAEKPVVAKAVTIEVTPDQAQAISLAHAIGSISLSLRQVSDHDPVAHKLTTIAELGGPRPAPVARPRPRVQKAAPMVMQVRVTRGVDTTGYPVGGS
jgi:pilus assembly protein CpaB